MTSVIGKVERWERGERRRYIQISWRKLRITGVRKRSVRTRRGEVRGIKYPGGGPVFSSDSALHSRRVSRFVRPSVRRWIIPSKKMKNFQERVTRRDVLFHGNTGEGELLSSEREAEGNLRESISPGQSYRAYVSSVCLWRGMRNISSGLISRLSCISFPPFALPSRSLPGINLFSSPSQRGRS